MKAIPLAALLIAASTTFALAGGDLAEKVMQDSPGVTGDGRTFDPTSKPQSGGLADKAMRILPGVNGAGSTVRPTAKPDDKSLSSKAMRDHPAIGG